MRLNDRIAAALIDTNFIVALLDHTDPLYEASTNAVRQTACNQWVTTWAVITESMYFLGSQIGVEAQQALCELICDGTYRVSGTIDISIAQRYLVRYSDMPLDFADASLAACATESGIKHIYTHDEHFRAVRVPIDSARVLQVLA